MPTYYTPRTDVGRLNFLNKAVATATASGAESRIDAALLAELDAFLTTFRTAHEAAQVALSNRVGETAEAAAALAKLRMYISHLWTAVYHRYLREGQSPTVLGYYRLGSDGTRPSIVRQQDALRIAGELISGEAQAVAAGFAPMSQPTIAELTAVLNDALTQATDSPVADAAYDKAQAAVAALRPEGDRLIKEVRDVLLFSARTMDVSSQRRILRNHGAVYYYSPGETIDEGDETAVVLEEGAEASGAV